VSTAPSAGAAFVADVRAAGVPVTRWYYDWAGGLVWLALEGTEPHAAKVRETLARHGGHATLVRADDAVRAATPVFHPQPAPLAALSKRIKASFDPAGILNRGRMG
jgi:glycolate oxidase FAD binding subunit